MASPPLADPRIQSELIADALRSASVGFLVWDDDRRYLAANDRACEILGTTLEELLGRRVGDRSGNVDELVEAAMRSDLVHGTVEVERFDGSGPVTVFYATFATRSAAMPFMATIIARVD